MTILNADAVEVISHSADQTGRFGVRMGQLLRAGDLLCLSGELGTGKTVFAIGVARGWGALENATSPTYILAHEYHRADGAQLHHLDCYRLRGPQDADSVGLTERYEAGVALMIEWPENVRPWLPEDGVWAALRHIDEDKRSLRLHAGGARGAQLLADFRELIRA